MPTNVDEFLLHTGTEAFTRRLQTIRVADGFNTDAGNNLLRDFTVASEVDAPPALFMHFDGIEPQQDFFGSQEPNASSRTHRLMGVYSIFGYVQDDSNPRRAMLALFADVMSAIWTDERLIEGGIPKGGHLMQLITADFDSLSFQDQGRAWFQLQVGSMYDLHRTGEP